MKDELRERIERFHGLARKAGEERETRRAEHRERFARPCAALSGPHSGSPRPYLNAAARRAIHAAQRGWATTAGKLAEAMQAEPVSRRP